MTTNPGTAGLGQLGDYELLTLIGAGGTCEVFRSRHRQTGAVVAIKVLPAVTAQNPLLRRRFEQEFRVASRLEHPNIVRTLDFWELPGQSPFLVMELVEGESLGAKVEREGPLSEEVALRLIAGACRGLQYAHEHGVVHRDVKPDNLLLTTNGDVRVTDFGLVKELLIDQGLTKTGRGLGTPHYMAPEQFRDAKTVDLRADVYGLGATLYTLVTGTLPFAGSSPLEAWIRKKEARLRSPRTVVPALSPRTEQVILRAMEGDPQRRPASCTEFLRELTGTVEEVRLPTPPADLLDVWYVRYENQEGQEYVLHQPLEKVRHYLRTGRFRNARQVRVSRTEAGPFLLPDEFEELREIANPPAAQPARDVASSPWAWAAIGLLTFGVTLLAIRLLR